MEFKIGDLVDVGTDIQKIRGHVTQIYYDVERKPYKIEVRRESGSHNEYLKDPEIGFGFVTKVEE